VSNHVLITQRGATVKDETNITPQQLREAAEAALQLDEFLDKCGQDGVLSLMGFDLDWLARKFDEAADRLDRLTS
jgi:hypothetical protein